MLQTKCYQKRREAHIVLCFPDTLPLTWGGPSGSGMTLDKSFDFSELQFPHLLKQGFDGCPVDCV